MTLDAFAFEPQFLAHLAPVWRTVPPFLRGTFYVEDRDPPLVEDAIRRGIEPTPLTGFAVRSQSAPPKARPGDGPLALVASIGDTKIARRMGYRRFIFLEHGAGQSYSGTGSNPMEASYSGGPDREDVVLFLVPNHQAAERWRRSYPGVPVEVVGCPRLGDLPARIPDGQTTVAISWHFDPPHSLPPEAMSALGDYLPALPELAKRFHLIGHAHPRHGATMERLYRKAGVEFVPDFEDVCRRADVYACDNSSTIFEFASTGRPVVLMNAKHYRKSVDHKLRFWEAATIGIQVDDRAQLGDAIEAALVDPPEQQAAREAALRIVYPVGAGAGEAAKAIVDWMAEAVAA